jgi:hypothetical protein
VCVGLAAGEAHGGWDGPDGKIRREEEDTGRRRRNAGPEDGWGNTLAGTAGTDACSRALISAGPGRRSQTNLGKVRIHAAVLRLSRRP